MRSGSIPSMIGKCKIHLWPKLIENWMVQPGNYQFFLAAIYSETTCLQKHPHLSWKPSE